MTGHSFPGSHWALVLMVTLALSACVSKDDGPAPRSSAPSVASSSPPSISSSSSSGQSSIASSLPSSADSSVSSSQSNASSQGGGSSVATTVTVSGKITYDFVPLPNGGGLDYAATEERPVRGAIIRLLDSSDTELALSATDDDGHYSFIAPANTQARLQVLARSQSTGAQQWDIQVQDNTANNGLYAMGGNLATTGSSDQLRDLHAPSGWGGNFYTEPRVAAPFAILDTAYEALLRLRAVDAALHLPVSYFRWSENNTTASGNIADGDIGTSFYGSPGGGDPALYILGQEDVDTDEYDRHIIAHEWAHYLEDALTGRLDSLGGGHSLFDRLDKRLAWSEGLANAFSAIALDNVQYLDSIESGQSSAFGFNIANTSNSPEGWFNEGSVQSIVYNFAEQQGFDKIYSVLTDNQYKNTDALLSIFAFSERLSELYPGAPTTAYSNLLNQQDINSLNQYAVGETNNGNIPNLFPLYRSLQVGAPPINVCSDQRNGTDNKLGVLTYFRFNVSASASYTITVQQTESDGRETDPDFYVYYRGDLVGRGDSFGVDLEANAISFQAGRDYVLSVYDWEIHPSAGSPGYQPSCFDVSIVSN
ncbi:MAG TPA: hypothetical protein VIC08_01960 [Cellvibrionaceae bacterium]